ncbi:MAG: GNAT family N-acetyltransferase [Candidatus Thorarchaeota archaeon]|nr:GNAT family N-acetyltransferase [Candidatus Thorarchaeota archaeon]
MVEEELFFYGPGDEEMLSDYAMLYNLSEGYDNKNHSDYTARYFRSAFQSSGTDLSKDVVLVRDSAGFLVAAGTIFVSEELKRAQLVIHVHPKYRRRGIGTSLFLRLRLRAMNQHVNELSLRALSFRPYAIAFAASLGFHHINSRVKMRLDFTEPVRPALYPWGFKVRALHPQKELETWATLQNKLFKNTMYYAPVTSQSLESRSKLVGFDPNLVVLGEVRNIPVGLCVGWTVSGGTDERDGKILQINALGVLAEHRRKGYGLCLLQEVMNRAYLKGHTRVELLVDIDNSAAIGLYHKVGLRETYRHMQFTYSYC